MFLRETLKKNCDWSYFLYLKSLILFFPSSPEDSFFKPIMLFKQPSFEVNNVGWGISQGHGIYSGMSCCETTALLHNNGAMGD